MAIQTLDEKTAAALIGVEAATLRENAKCGRWKIRFNHRNNRHYRYNQSDVHLMLNEPEKVITSMPNRWMMQKRKKKMLQAG